MPLRSVQLHSQTAVHAEYAEQLQYECGVVNFQPEMLLQGGVVPSGLKKELSGLDGVRGVAVLFIFI